MTTTIPGTFGHPEERGRPVGPYAGAASFRQMYHTDLPAHVQPTDRRAGMPATMRCGGHKEQGTTWAWTGEANGSVVGGGVSWLFGPFLSPASRGILSRLPRCPVCGPVGSFSAFFRCFLIRGTQRPLLFCQGGDNCGCLGANDSVCGYGELAHRDLSPPVGGISESEVAALCPSNTEHLSGGSSPL